MTIPRTALCLALLAALGSFTGCGRKAAKTTAPAAQTLQAAPQDFIKINGTTISKDDYINRLEHLSMGGKSAGQAAIEQLIHQNLLKQLAEKENVVPTDAQVNARIKQMTEEAGDMKTLLALRGTTEELLKQEVFGDLCAMNLAAKKASVTDAQIKTEYDKDVASPQSAFKRPDQVLVSAIVSADKATIDKAYERLNKGEDFGAVAVDASDPRSNARASKGRIGWMSKGSGLPPVLSDPLFALAEGSYTKPIQQDQFWVILKADQKRKATTLSLQDAKPAILQKILASKPDAAKAYEDSLKAFTKDAQITVNYEPFKDVPGKYKSEVAAAKAPAPKPAPKPAP